MSISHIIFSLAYLAASTSAAPLAAVAANDVSLLVSRHGARAALLDNQQGIAIVSHDLPLMYYPNADARSYHAACRLELEQLEIF